MTDVLILTGPCGIGKSTTAFECMEILEEAQRPAAMIDAELAYFHPKPGEDPWGYAVAERALRALANVYAEEGLSRLLLSRVVENAEQLAIVERAIPDASIQVFRLEAAEATIRRRLEKREIGSGLEWHVQRSREIASATLGTPLSAEGSTREIAETLLRRAGWLPAS